MSSANNAKSSPSMIEISVVIPAYNELERLPPTLETVRTYLKENFASWEIIVSDDGSDDGMIDQLRSKFTDVRFIRSPINQGKGAAVRRGMLDAKGRYVLFSDADLSTPIDELKPLIKAMEEARADGAIASRGMPESKLVVRQPWYRECAGRLFNMVVRPLTGLPFYDTQCGFKLFRREAARSVFSVATANGFAFDVEVLMIAQMLGYTIVEVPVRWINAEGTKLNFAVHGPKMIADIMSYRWRRFSGVYQDRAREEAA
jgi:dolichyl-phosphate beta-glucosyltransferase